MKKVTVSYCRTPGFLKYFFSKALILTGILSISANIVFAEDDTQGAINGYIKTDDSQPATFMQVKLQPIGIQTLYDEAGYFIFDKAPPGAYSLEVSGVNIDPFTQSVTVTAGKTEKLNIVLNISARELYSVGA